MRKYLLGLGVAGLLAASGAVSAQTAAPSTEPSDADRAEQMCRALPERWARLAIDTRELAITYAFHRRLLSTATPSERVQLQAAEEPLRRATDNVRGRERVLGEIEMHCLDLQQPSENPTAPVTSPPAKEAV